MTPTARRRWTFSWRRPTADSGKTDRGPLSGREPQATHLGGARRRRRAEVQAQRPAALPRGAGRAAHHDADRARAAQANAQDGGGRRELAGDARRGDAPDPAAVELGEPEVAVRAGGDAGGGASLADPLRELRHDPAGRDAPDAVSGQARPIELGEPEVAVRAGGDAGGGAAGADARSELGHRALRGDPPDPVPHLREPDVAVGAGGDAGGTTLADGELGDRAGRGDAPDAVAPARAGGLGEPQVAVRAGGDRAGDVSGDARRELGHDARRA